MGLHVFVAPVPRWESLLACLRPQCQGIDWPSHPGRVAHLLLMVYHCFSKVYLNCFFFLIFFFIVLTKLKASIEKKL